MHTYSSLQFIHKDKGQEQVMTNNTFTLTKIENMKNILKSHRAALDFDRGFIITSVLRSSDFTIGRKNLRVVRQRIVKESANADWIAQYLECNSDSTKDIFDC
jgi:hypothetical protein